MTTYSQNAMVKRRLRSEIPSGETQFDTDLDEARTQAYAEIVEALKEMDVTVGVTSPPSIIQHAEADLAAALYVEDHTEKYTTPKHERKSTALRARAMEQVQRYLNATQEGKYWVNVNDVDSGVE